MDERQNTNTDEDLLEQATQALCQTPVPKGPPGDALAKVVAAADDAACQPTTQTFTQRIGAMNPPSKITAAAASLIVICGALAWMFTAGGGTSVALADVANVLDKIRSATFTGTITSEGEEPITSKAMFLEPSRSRMESSRGIVMIFGESKMVTLVPEKKFAVVFDLEDVPDDGVVKNWLEDVRQKIRTAIDGSQDEIETLGSRTIDGRDAVGFRLRIENVEMTVWADPETALPIRVEKSSGLMKPKTHTVMSDFRFNVNLDESLFSVEPPEGYTVQEQNMDASKSAEHDFVAMLRTHSTEHQDGTFPSTLASSVIERGVTHAVQEEINEKFGDWRSDAELREKVLQSNQYKKFMQLAMQLGRGLGFLHELSPDADWHYAGNDVKLGTPDRPIFWYKPTGSENYRVIYADLSVEEVAAEKLKGFPEASVSE